mgnify:CR=1 FL=1
MVEFFQNIGHWFVENKDEIVLFFTSTNFISFVSAIVLIVKQIRTTKTGTSTIRGLSETLNKTNELAEKVADVSNVSEKSLNTSIELDAKVERMEKVLDESIDVIRQKVNAMLEVQSIIYSSVKDETARKNVSNILASAKLTETASVAELQKQIEDLKSTLAEKMTETSNAVQEASEKVNDVIATHKKQTTLRY